MDESPLEKVSFIDSHCHLEMCEEKPEILLERAKQAGLLGVVTVGTDVPSAKWGLNLRESKQMPLPTYPTMGLYPDRAKGSWREAFSEIESLARSEKFFAIGEVGLDAYWEKDYLDEQQAMLKAHIQLALELNLPLILHCREAFDLMINLLKEFSSHQNFSGVWHCFDGSLDEAKQALDLGLDISLSGIITFKKSKLKDFLGQLPLDRLHIETDSPYLSPVPKRGRKNEPAHVAHTFKELCQCFSLSEIEFSKILLQNTRRLFSIHD